MLLYKHENLLTLKDADIFDNAQNLPVDNWRTRKAARAITFSNDGRVYLLKMANQNYHKLPGGGVDKGESLEETLYRELLEEIGCPAKVTQELGEIVEYRNDEKLIQYSYCFIAKQTNSLTETTLEKGEINDGAQTVIAKNIDEAIKLLENDKPKNYEGHFIRLRDLRFLREAKSVS